MGLFHRPRAQQPHAATGTAPGVLGSGLHILMPAPLAQAAVDLEAAMATFRPRQYPELPRLVPAGWTWVGEDASRPDGVWCGGDGANAPIIVSLRGVHAETDVGLYPLGDGDERLSAPGLTALAGFLRGSAARRVAPAGTIALGPPPIPADLLEEMLRAARRPPTAANVDAVGRMFVTQVKLKASQFVQNSAGHDRAMAYLDRWALLRGDHLEVARGVLADLCGWDATVIPYVQDIPLRMRAIMLHAVDRPGTFWVEVK